MLPYRVLICLLVFASTLRLQAQKSPADYFSHPYGEQFTGHALLESYYKYLAEAAPQRMRLQVYGQTEQYRTLMLAIFSSPENLARLDEIRLNNLRIAGLADGQANLDNAPAIVWLSLTVHGNEPSGAEMGMNLAWLLVSQSQANVSEWLRNTVVIIDPCLNPDGYDRYAHWYRGVSQKRSNPNPDAREHEEPWPRGRSNHYLFDLNRDWAWGTQRETRDRLRVFQEWMPHIHADVHEQGVDAPYFFAPAAEPMHDYISDWQSAFQEEMGRRHAQTFDQNGWLYFTKEVFDLFYPSYGDTYPMFSGAIGMTYEQAGHSTAGRAIATSAGQTLTLRERIEHHQATCLNTIEMGSKHAGRLVSNFRDYYRQSVSKPHSAYKSYVIPKSDNNPNKIKALCELLSIHGIHYGLFDEGRSGLKAFDYVKGKETSISVQPGDLVISAFQPRSTLLQVLMEPHSRLSDSLTYDITAWALPHAYGLQAYALKERLEPGKPYEPYLAPAPCVSAPPYAWCVRMGSLAEHVFLQKLLEKGIVVRQAQKAFSTADQKFNPGDLAVLRADNRDKTDADQIITEAARQANVALIPVFTGYAGTGADFGSSTFRLLKPSSIGVVYGPGIDAYAYGALWYFLEQELDCNFTPLDLQHLARYNLSKYDILILPDGNYGSVKEETLANYVRQGGKLILMENAARTFTNLADAGLSLKSRNADKDETRDDYAPITASERERDWISGSLPGAVIKAKTDPSSPLTYGMGDHYFTLKSGAETYEMPSGVQFGIWIDREYDQYGFIGAKVKKQLGNSPVVFSKRMGKGEVAWFLDNPLFRCFWYQGKTLFGNALIR